MSIELTTTEIGKINTVYNSIVEQSVDCDVTLPDYCPDIMRILKCNVMTNITNAKINGDRATADGTAIIKVIYADEGNRIFCYEHEYPFSKFTELSGSFDSPCFSVYVKNSYANCRAVSKRRIDIHGAVSMSFLVNSVMKDNMISNAVGDGVQTKRKGIDFSSATAKVSKIFQISEVESISNSNPNINKVLFVNTSPILSETKIIRGKALLKGEICFNIVYSADGESNDTCQLSYSIPFNEIAEIESLNDDSIISVEFSSLQTTAEPKADSDGNYRFLALCTDIQAVITCYEKKCTSTICDTYSTQAVLDTKYAMTEFKALCQCTRDKILCKQKLDIASANPEKIYSTTIGIPDSSCIFESGRMIIKGSLPVDLIVIGEDGMPSYCQRNADFEYSCSCDTVNPQCRYSLCVTGYSCTLTGDKKADFKCEINLLAEVCSSFSCRALTELSVSQSGEVIEKNPSLTIYFCSGGENVWDIARKYNTTVEEIMDENNLSADSLPEKTILLIPVK